VDRGRPVARRPGFVILERQLILPGSGGLDLLCVDQQGRVAVVEIKRGKLIRETIAQALDYASVIASWSTDTLREHVSPGTQQKYGDHPGVRAVLEQGDDEPREVEIVVVGCGADSAIDRMVDFLGERYAVPIRAVTFEVFELADGSQILVRHESEPEAQTVSATRGGYTIESVIEKAGGPESPNGRRFMQLVKAAEEIGLHPRPYKWSIMMAPPTMRTRFLINIWRPNRNELSLSYSADAIAEFFPVEASVVQGILGAEGKITTDQEADAWAAKLRRLGRAFSGGSREGDDDLS
jgi:hypothetical protein